MGHKVRKKEGKCREFHCGYGVGTLFKLYATWPIVPYLYYLCGVLHVLHVKQCGGKGT